MNSTKSINGIVCSCQTVRKRFHQDVWLVINELQLQNPQVFTSERIESEVLIGRHNPLDLLESLVYACAINKAVGLDVYVKVNLYQTSPASSINIADIIRNQHRYPLINAIVDKLKYSIGDVFLANTEFLKYSSVFNNVVYLSLYNTDDVILTNHDI